MLCMMFFYDFFHLYNELFLNTVNGVPNAVNIHLLKAGVLGFQGA